MALVADKFCDHVVACNKHDFFSSSIVKEEGVYFKVQRDSKMRLPDSFAELGACSHAGLCLVTKQNPATKMVGVYSMFTNECVAVINARTSRYVVGVNVVAFVCANGVKACQLSAPDQMAWVHRSNHPLRIAMFPDSDNLIVVECQSSKPTATVVRLDLFDYQSQTSHVASTQHVDAPAIAGPIMCLRNCEAHFVFLVNGEPMACVCNVKDSSQSGCTSLRMKGCVTGSTKVNARDSHVVVQDNGTVVAVVAMVDENSHQTNVLQMLKNNKARMRQLPKRAELVVANDTVLIWHENRSMFACCTKTTTATLSSAGHNHLAPINFHAKTLHALCARCRGPRTTEDHDSVCALCTTPGTVSHAFGGTCQYLRHKYHYQLSPTEARALKAVFVADPTCVVSGQSYAHRRLVFVSKRSDKRITTIKDLMLVEFRFRDTRLKKIFGNVADQRWRRFCKTHH